jgi:hypothetical protein
MIQVQPCASVQTTSASIVRGFILYVLHALRMSRAIYLEYYIFPPDQLTVHSNLSSIPWLLQEISIAAMPDPIESQDSGVELAKLAR